MYFGPGINQVIQHKRKRTPATIKDLPFSIQGGNPAKIYSKSPIERNSRKKCEICSK